MIGSVELLVFSPDRLEEEEEEDGDRLSEERRGKSSTEHCLKVVLSLEEGSVS